MLRCDTEDGLRGNLNCAPLRRSSALPRLFHYLNTGVLRCSPRQFLAIIKLTVLCKPCEELRLHVGKAAVRSELTSATQSTTESLGL